MKSDSGEKNDDHLLDQKIANDETRPARSYDCTFCKRGFTNAQALGGHMNIHRKDKAKAKESKSSPTKSYDHSSMFSIPSSEVPNNNYLGLAQSSYQVHFPSYPSHQAQYDRPNFDASRGEQRDRGEYHGELDLSLNFGVSNDEYSGRRSENEDGMEDGNKVDLELRLGNQPR